MRELTPKQEKFVEVFLETSNASEAYRQAYDVGENTKATTIKRRAHDVLNDSNVKATIADRKEKTRKKYDLKRDDIIQMYMAIINSHEKLRGVFDGKSISASAMKKVYAMSNSGYIRGSDVKGAIDKVAEMLGLDKPPEVREQENKVTIEIIRKDSND